MNAYSSFAVHYDGLMQVANYTARADYICAVLEKLSHCAGLTLDLACGTGNLTVELAKRGFDIYGVDGCAEMLMQAQEKAAQEGLSLLFLCQNMQNLDLYGTVQTVVCTLDSLNHLTSLSDVKKAFARVSLFLEEGGYFLFDVNTVYKHRNLLSGKTFVYDTKDVYCVWQNGLVDEKDRVRISLDFFEKTGAVYRRSSTHFYERAYDENVLRELLQETGFSTVHVWEDGTFETPGAQCARIFIAAKKETRK